MGFFKRHRGWWPVFVCFLATASIYGGRFLNASWVLSLEASFFNHLTAFMGWFDFSSKEIELLKKENASLKIKILMYAGLEKEVSSMETLLKSPLATGKLARVLSSSMPFIIEGGSEAGLKIGQGVLSAEGVVGRIIYVGEKTSRVSVITDFDFRLPVMTKDVHFMAAGGMPLSVVYFKSQIPVDQGETVWTSGYGGIFPAYLPVGKLVQQGNEQKIQPFAAPHRLTYVFVLPLIELQ